MSKVLRTLGRGGLAAVLGAVLLGFVGVTGAQEASAESPPAPPARFVGTVLVDGVAPPAGTAITAKIGAATCGTGSVFKSGNESRYQIDVPALDPGATPNCGADGATVVFYIGDKLAKETGSWASYQLNVLNLTYTTPATPTATATASGSPSASATGTGTAAPPTGTPKPPVTGNVAAAERGSTTWLFVVAGLGALALGLGGTVAARRSR